MKVFLSLPFGERDEATIRSHIEDMKKVFDRYYRLSNKQSSVEYVHNYDCVLDKDKVYNKTSVGYLGYALEQLAQCDAILFGLGHEKSEGCRAEKYVARLYNIKMYDEGEIIKYLQRREPLFCCESDPKVQVQIKYLREGMKPLECHGNFIDVYTPDEVVIPPQGFKLIKLGVAMKVPEGYWCQLVPRSSTFKKYHILMANSFGVIDNSYCGDEDEWMFAAFNPMDEEETKIPAGTRIAQFRVVKDIPTELVTVDHLSDVNRGGFGSTGN